jgi:tripeptide aminopeptidase
MSDNRYETSCVERFLRYVKVDTQSNEDSDSFPSTPGQLDLLRILLKELKELGIEDATMDEYGYVFGTIPATPGKQDAPVIGLLAHVDTSPEMSGADVKPIIHKNYQGGDLQLPDDPDTVIRGKDVPYLAEQIGQDIITASGTTLLGADNKAGVAEIMGAVEYLMAHPEIEHGSVRVGFTPDEEIGAGADHFDVERFGAHCAYTMDGEVLGELEIETFAADSLTLTFHGFNTHPGMAKDKLINAIKIAANFICRLPEGRLSPETTSDQEGFVHPYVMKAGVDATAVKFLLRSFNASDLDDQAALLGKLADETVVAFPGSKVEIVREESYRNMKEILDQHPEVVEKAKQAIRNAGLALRMQSIRGGTDGARLSFMGLPTPNIFAGEHNFHSRYEWISIRDMHKAVEVIIELCKLWAEPANEG